MKLSLGSKIIKLVQTAGSTIVVCTGKCRIYLEIMLLDSVTPNEYTKNNVNGGCCPAVRAID